jgi:hypothetical protein
MSYNQAYEQDTGENVSYNSLYSLDVIRRNTLLPVIKSTAPNWSIIPSETNISRAEPHYGTVDALSMSANGRLIVGSFETNKAYLYNENLDIIHIFEGSGRFGIRCSIDDSGSIIVIASNTHLYIYEGPVYEVVKIITLPYGNGPSASPWNMKISKDGSTIIASNNVGSSSFEAWTTGDKWSTVNGPVVYSSFNSQRASAIDLSANGLVMIAAGISGFVNLFSRGTSTPVHNIVIPEDGNSIGQSIALSGDGKKAIVGAPNSIVNVSSSASVYFIDIEGTTMNTPVSKIFLSTTNARYGRSVSMDYDGRYAMVSGSMSEYRFAESVGDNADGSAMVIDASTYTIAKELTKTSLNYQAGATYELMLNGYGIHCKLSNQGGVAAVSGGGYAFLFKI